MLEGLLLQHLEGFAEKGQSLVRKHEHPAMRGAGGKLYNVKNTHKTNLKGKNRPWKLCVLREQWVEKCLRLWMREMEVLFA